MLKDAESFSKNLEVEVVSSVPKVFIEIIAVVVLSFVSFFVICTISYMINDLIPEWRTSETLLKSFLLVTLETTLTFVIFHQYYKLMQNIINSIFPSTISNKIYPELFSFVLITLAIYLFQESLLIRTKTMWVYVFGDKRENNHKHDQEYVY